jgi:hypothetical protein
MVVSFSLFFFHIDVSPLVSFSFTTEWSSNLLPLYTYNNVLTYFSFKSLVCNGFLQDFSDTMLILVSYGSCNFLNFMSSITSTITTLANQYHKKKHHAQEHKKYPGKPFSTREENPANPLLYFQEKDLSPPRMT